jgi:hypothetical protein
MKVNEINPATLYHLEIMQHYARLMSEKRIIDNLEENRKRENARRVQESGKGQNVDVYV